MQMKTREYERVKMVFKETNNKRVAMRDVVSWSYKVDEFTINKCTPSGWLDNEVHPIQVKGSLSRLRVREH